MEQIARKSKRKPSGNSSVGAPVARTGRGSASAALGEQTRTNILDVAEQICAEEGFEAFSIRVIAERAQVNVSAINYHFKSKEGLFEEMFQRRVLPLNEERIRLLDECVAGRGKPRVEDVVRCFVAPPMRLEFTDGGVSAHVVMQFLGRVFAMPGERGFLEKYYEPVRSRFITTLMTCLPELSIEEVLWRYNLMVGSLIYAMGGAPRMMRSPLALADRKVRENVSADEVIDLISGFIVHGMKGAPALGVERTKKRAS